MYYIAKEIDFDILRNSFDVANEYCKTELGFGMPTVTDEELMAHIQRGGIVMSDLGEDNYCANVCFEVYDEYVLINWTIEDTRHLGDADAILSYIILNYKRPLRYWLVAETQPEEETIEGSQYLAENTVYLEQEKVDEYGRTMRLYEFTAPELELFREGE
jgi:hypothetical protein